MKGIIIVRILLISSCVSLCCAQEIKTGSPEFVRILHDGALAQFTLRVVDDEGAAVANANVQVSFAMENSKWIMGRSDTNGVFAATGQSRGDMLYDVTKDGYYRTADQLKFGRHDGVVVKDGKWQPWNPEVKVVLRPVENPIPMYAKRVETRIPVLDQFVGFDLEKADWVVPYGSGQMSDISFRMQKRYVDMRDFDSSFDVAVTNCVDGLQETTLTLFQSSEFKLARMAPAREYPLNEIHLSESSTNYFVPNKDLSYYFRVRTVTNEIGELTSAMYGKIRSYIGFDVRRDLTGKIKFTYYLNPTPNDRNMEFDPKQNLFKNLSSLEQVTAP